MTDRERVDSPLRTAAGPARARPPAPPSAPSVRRPAPSEPVALPLRELTGWEEEYLERHQHEPNTARVCNEVLARCCVPPGRDPGDEVRDRVGGLLIAERDRELVRLRRMSLGPDIEAQVECPSCGGANQASFSLDALDLGFEVSSRQERVEVDDGDAVELWLPTATDQEDLLDAGIDNPAERRTWLLARCVREPGGEPLGLDAARALPVRRRAALERAIEARVPTLDLEMALECIHCRTAFTAPFDVAIFFFFDMIGRAARMLDDVHRIALAYHWSEPQIWDLPLRRRLAYLLRLEADADAALLADVTGTGFEGPP